MTLRAKATGLALSTLVAAASASAGLLNSHAPKVGQNDRGTVVYRMGPIHYEPGGWVDTTVTCTNLTASSARVAFEIFDENDKRAGGIAHAQVAGGASVTFATSTAAEAPDAVIVRRLPAIDHGKARVSASTIQLSCTALNRIRANDGSVKEAALELVKKVAYGN